MIYLTRETTFQSQVATYMSGSAKCAPYDNASFGFKTNLNEALRYFSLFSTPPLQPSPPFLLLRGGPGTPEPGTPAPDLTRGGREKFSHDAGLESTLRSGLGRVWGWAEGGIVRVKRG